MESIISSMWFLFLWYVSAISTANGCVDPSGLGSNPGELDPSTLDLPVGEVYQAYVDIIDPFVLDFETPIQFRLIELSSAVIWNGMYAYEDTVLDHFGRETESEDRRRCQGVLSDDLFDLHRRITLAYVWYFSGTAFFPNSEESMNGVLNGFGLNESICDPNIFPDFDCTDVSTPWGLAYVANDEVYKWSQFDGWNGDGSLDRDYNKIPYSDFRGEYDEYADGRYIPVNNPWVLEQTDRWQPLLESDSNGFLYYQEHVTSHIGQTGKSWFLTEDELCSFEVDDPNYDYTAEIELTFNRLKDITDEEKMLVEFYDFKPSSIGALNGQFWKRQGIALDDWEFIEPNFIINNVLYETVLIVWKEKLRFDKVRPPSIIQSELDEQLITTYGGRSEDGLTFGTQTFEANDFEPYIRTMPHSEYPSASACACEAYAQIMKNIVGTDDITSILFGQPLFLSFSPFTSDLEPLSTPQNFIFKTYSTFSEISDECGQSRLNGGMHFTASVPNGADLCRGVSDIIFERFSSLINGNVPDYVTDPKDETIPNRACATMPGTDSSSSESSDSDSSSASSSSD